MGKSGTFQMKNVPDFFVRKKDFGKICRINIVKDE